MHELSLAESVRDLIEDAAQAQGFTRVMTVRLEIGKLSCVEPEAMRFCFEAAMKDSVAEGARLEMAATPGRGRCGQCGAEAEIGAVYDPCPQCGAHAMQVIAGDAMRVIDLEVV